MVKIVFPEELEKELIKEIQQSKNNAQQDKSTSIPPNNTPSTSSNQINEIQEPPKLSKAQLKAREEAIKNISSKLYTPESPFKEEYQSKRPEIEERLKRINERFERLKLKEEAKNAELQRQAWLKYNHLTKPTISDFKRPITSFLLLASAIYMTMQYTWFALERENHIEDLENKQSQLVDNLNTALLNQQVIINQYNNPSNNNKSWWKFW